jgi:hypothetical protein
MLAVPDGAPLAMEPVRLLANMLFCVNVGLLLVIDCVPFVMLFASKPHSTALPDVGTDMDPDRLVPEVLCVYDVVGVGLASVVVSTVKLLTLACWKFEAVNVNDRSAVVPVGTNAENR